MTDSVLHKRQHSETMSNFTLISEGLKKSDEELHDICVGIIGTLRSEESTENPFEGWTSTDKHKSKLIHMLVTWNKPKTIRAIQDYVNINEGRSTDQCTPLHLSAWTKKPELIDLLIELGADPMLRNKYGEDTEQLVKVQGQKSNIAFLDLELTGLPSTSPHILEIALIITDKNLTEIERGHWLVKPSQEIIDGISEFGKKEFRDTSLGGNNLLADVAASGRPMEEVEVELMDMLTKHCPPQICPLGGNSVHCDREVLKERIPAVYAHMSHQIIDVSTVLNLLSRWLPSVLNGLWSQGGGDNGHKTAHRAMEDIERSISTLKYTREHGFVTPP
jgi:oligoribonuclease